MPGPKSQIVRMPNGFGGILTFDQPARRHTGEFARKGVHPDRGGESARVCASVAGATQSISDAVRQNA
jgi:hypothetical protein